MMKKKLNVKPSLITQNLDSVRHGLDTESAQLASRKLKQLTSTFGICEYCFTSEVKLKVN